MSDGNNKSDASLLWVVLGVSVGAGAAIGSILGYIVGDPVRGISLGGMFGAGIGILIGSNFEKD